MHSLVRCAICYHFHVVVTTRLEIRLEATWNILDARIGVRTLKEIGYLAAERLRTVNGVPTKGDRSKKILLPFVNWNYNIDFVAFRLKLVTRSIDYSVQKTFSNVESLNQMRALLQVCGHKGEPFFHARVSLAGRTHHVFEQFVRRLM